MAANWPISPSALHRRPPFARAPGLAVPPGLEGYAPGTPALPQIRPSKREAGAAELTSVPDAYRWDGIGTAPDAIYQLAVDVACLFGQGADGLPAPSDPRAGDFVGATYLALVDAGLSHDDIYGTIAALAPAGPQAIANALEQKIRKAGHGDKLHPCQPPTVAITAPTPPAVTPRAPAPAAAPVVLAPSPTAKKGAPWGWILGGVGLVAAIGVGWYFATRKPKRRNPPPSVLEVRENPCAACACKANPSDVIDTEGHEVFENPYSGTRGYSSVDPSIMAYDAALGMSPAFRVNPASKRRRPGKRRPKA
jgi:hypothetical protein